MVCGILSSLSNNCCVNIGDLWEAAAKTALNRERFYDWCKMSMLKKTGREPEKATMQIRPNANLQSCEGEERTDWEERSLGGNFIVNGKFGKAVGESLSQSWLTKESFVFPGWSALRLTLPLLTCETHVLSSNTEVRLQSGRWGPHFCQVVLTAATTTKPASPNLDSFLISAPKLWPAFWKAQSKWSADTHTQWFRAFQNEYISCPSTYCQSPKYQGQSLLFSFAFQIQIPDEVCGPDLYPSFSFCPCCSLPMVWLQLWPHYLWDSGPALLASLQVSATSQLFFQTHFKCCCQTHLEGQPCFNCFCP